MSRDALETYLEPRLESIHRDVRGTPTVVMPGFFGRQRTGRRQNLLGVGLDFITMKSEAGVKRVLLRSGRKRPPPGHRAAAQAGSAVGFGGEIC